MDEEEFNLEELVPFEKTEIHSTALPLMQPNLQTSVVLKDGNTYTTYAAVKEGGVYLRFSEISIAKQSIDCVMEIELKVQNEHHPKFSQRVDLRSASARKSLATDLNAAYGDKKAGYNWVLLLNVAFNQVVDQIHSEQKPVSVLGEKYEEIPFLLHPFLQENVSNLLFAQSEAGKTWFALRMAIAMAAGGPFLNYQVEGGKKTLFLDYEDDIRTFTNRLHKLCKGARVPFEDVAGMIQYYKPTGSFRDNTELIKDVVVKGNFDLIIIDAGGDATGGSPSDEEKVLDLFNALEEVRVTKLILHHEPKNVQNESAAFYGSMYWKARSRVAWRLEVENQDGGEKQIKATIQKRSNLPYIEPIYYKTCFDGVNIDEALSGTLPLIPAVRIELSPLRDIKKDRSTDELVIEVLEKHGALGGNQIADILGVTKSTINRCLKNLEDKSIVEVKKNGKSFIWSIK